MNESESSVLISVCMPVKNREDVIDKVLEAIKDQDFEKMKLELIFVDSSTDRTTGILESFKKFNDKLYNSIRIVKAQCNISKARNICIRESRGKYILFLDSDIVPSPFVFKRLLSLSAKADIACINYSSCDKPEVKKVRFVGMGCTIISRKLLKRVFFDENMPRGEDVDFCFRAHKMGATILLDSTIAASHLTQKQPHLLHILVDLAKYLKPQGNRQVLVRYFKNELSAPSLPYILFDLLKRNPLYTCLLIVAGFPLAFYLAVMGLVESKVKGCFHQNHN